MPRSASLATFATTAFFFCSLSEAQRATCKGFPPVDLMPYNHVHVPSYIFPAHYFCTMSSCLIPVILNARERKRSKEIIMAVCLGCSVATQANFCSNVFIAYMWNRISSCSVGGGRESLFSIHLQDSIFFFPLLFAIIFLPLFLFISLALFFIHKPSFTTVTHTFSCHLIFVSCCSAPVLGIYLHHSITQ